MEFISQTPDNPFILYTNRKVMTSRLEGEPGLADSGIRPYRLPYRLTMVARRIYRDYFLRGYKRYLLVRHPMRRLESLYRHLVLKEQLTQPHPIRSTNDIESDTADMMLIMYYSTLAIYGQRWATRLFQTRQCHAWVSFRMWIESMPTVLADSKRHTYFMCIESHFKPQYWILHPTYTRLFRHMPKQIQCDRVLKIEHAQDRAFITDKLGIDMGKRENTTQHVDVDTIWTPRMRKIVSHYYREDFARFGYCPDEA